MLAISLTDLNVVYAQDEELPPDDLLEWLGEGVKVEEEWVDPMDYENMQNVLGQQVDDSGEIEINNESTNQ